jgi:hypothetical protein
VIRLYVVPLVSFDKGRGPKYFKWRYSPLDLNVPWNLTRVRLKDSNSAIIAADVTPEQHGQLVLHPDIFVSTLDIAEKVNTDQRRDLGRTAMIGCGIDPAIVDTGKTFRQILRQLSGLEPLVQEKPIIVSGILIDVRPG